MTGLFPDDAVIRRVGQESVLLLGGGRALLMQLAHPGVAAGVAEHSRFQDDPVARLRHTLDATSALVFGDDAEVHRAAAAIRAVHERVVGDDYRATDPALALWVHATLVDTALRVYSRFMRPLPPADQAQYYREATVVAEHMGVPRHVQPPDLSAFRRYVRRMVDELTVTEEGRRLGRAVLHPRLGWATEPPFVALSWPGLLLARQLTVGLLPASLRRQYGLGWDCGRQAALETAAAASRQVLPRLPPVVRRTPSALLVAP